MERLKFKNAAHIICKILQVPCNMKGSIFRMSQMPCKIRGSIHNAATTTTAATRTTRQTRTHNYTTDNNQQPTTILQMACKMAGSSSKMLQMAFSMEGSSSQMLQMVRKMGSARNPEKRIKLKKQSSLNKILPF